jgi:hypothetical protein
MMFKDLHRFIQTQQSQQQQQQTLLFERLRNKPFWIFDIEQHKAEAKRTRGDCCFNHIIGLPQKENKRFPLFPYEEILYSTLQEHKHVWVKKSTGLGITEFVLRYMVWLALKDDTYRNAQMPIVCGPNIDIAIKLIKRIKNMFEPFGILFDTKETVIVLNDCTIEAFPSNHLDAYRSLERPKFIFLDEADFFRASDQQDARDVSERYIAKSSPWVVMVSTPNKPGGLFEQIEKEPEDTCLYKRLFLDYTYGLDNIYTREEIEKAKQSPSFQREYDLKYLGVIGNVFHTQDIETAIEKGRNYNPDNFNPHSHFTSVSMGIDPAYGSSAFGIVVTQWVDGAIQVLYADEYHRPDYNEMLSVTYGLMSKYSLDKVYIDGANPSFIRSLKLQIGEEADYDKVIARYRSEGLGSGGDKDGWSENMRIVPVNFNTEHKAMLGHCKMIFESEGGRIAINPDRFDKLITSLRTAVDNDGTLDKEATSHHDIFDAFRLALKFYEFEQV